MSGWIGCLCRQEWVILRIRARIHICFIFWQLFFSLSKVPLYNESIKNIIFKAPFSFSHAIFGFLYEQVANLEPCRAVCECVYIYIIGVCAFFCRVNASWNEIILINIITTNQSMFINYHVA